MATNKWTVSDASAKRIYKSWLLAIKDADSGLSDYPKLVECVRLEGCVGYNATGAMLHWIADTHPKAIGPLVFRLAGDYESLREKAKNYLGAFNSLSSEVDYEHWHHHEADKETPTEPKG